MDRRDFLRLAALTGLASTVTPSEAFDLLKQTGENEATKQAYDMVAVMGGEPEVMFRHGKVNSRRKRYQDAKFLCLYV